MPSTNRRLLTIIAVGAVALLISGIVAYAVTRPVGTQYAADVPTLATGLPATQTAQAQAAGTTSGSASPQTPASASTTQGAGTVGPRSGGSPPASAGGAGSGGSSAVESPAAKRPRSSGESEDEPRETVSHAVRDESQRDGESH